MSEGLKQVLSDGWGTVLGTVFSQLMPTEQDRFLVDLG